MTEIILPDCSRSDRQDLAGQTFGQWTVLSYAGFCRTVGGQIKTMWHCRCSCGTMKPVSVASLKRKRSPSRSCGCRGSRSQPLHDRLLDKVARAANGCWVWQGRTREQPPWSTGVIRIDADQHETVHRVAYRLFCGPIPEGLMVYHDCGNTLCCNPVHLFLGTNVEKTRLMVQKGRQARGERSPAARLTEDQVRTIKQRLAAGEWFRPMAKEYGVEPSTIWFIQQGRTWKHVT